MSPVARGYKAGGFNPAALPGSEAYGEEHAWHLEGGWKSTLSGGKVAASAAVFFINWDDLQLNVPNPFVPGQFYIANVGSASSSGAEFDVTRAAARRSRSVRVAGIHQRASSVKARWRTARPSTANRCPTRPTTRRFSADSGRTPSRRHQRIRARGIGLTGAFSYDEGNTEGQDAYSIVNIRPEPAPSGCSRNSGCETAFDTDSADRDSVSCFAPSGFIGENGPSVALSGLRRDIFLSRGSGSRDRGSGIS
jgi:hypothetical protein